MIVRPGRPAFRSAGSGGFGGFTLSDADAIALVAAMSVTPNATRQALIETTILALKSAGVWTKYDELYVFAAHDVQAALLNWVNPAQSATRGNSCTFTTDVGFTGNNNNMYIQGVSTLSAATNFTQNSCHIAGYTNSANAISDRYDIGESSGLTYLSMRVSGAGGFTSWAIQEGFGGNNTAQSDSTGSFVASRTGANAEAVYRNGSSFGSTTKGSFAPSATKLAWVGRALGGGQDGPRRFAYGSFGGGLSATEVSDKHTALLAYLTELGAQ